MLAKSRLLQLEHLVSRSGLDEDARALDRDKFRRLKEGTGHSGSGAHGAVPVRLAKFGTSADESFTMGPWTPDLVAKDYDRSPSPVPR
jgi:hypothetical protein